MNKAAAIYDFSQYPVSFDSCNFFAIFGTLCEKARIDSVSLFVICENFRSAPVEDDYTAHYQHQKMLDCVVSLGQLTKYIDNIHIVNSLEGLKYEHYDFLIDGIKPGSSLPRLYDFKTIEEVAGDIDCDYLNRLFQPFPSDRKKVEWCDNSVLFFKRDSEYNLPRNTPDQLFEKAAEVLAANGIDAVVIEDKERRPVNAGSRTLMDTLSERLAAAERSRLSIAWGGGVSAPLWFSQARLLICGMINEAVPVDSAEMAARKGPFRNMQPRWFKNQKQFWWEENQLITPERLALKCIDILKVHENLN